jgi:hypothetical protein
VARYRSGAVARMLRMPVATLRIWERRYRVAAPVTTPSGHRLYSAADVKRLSLLRQLTALGHAIGSLAGLDLPALRQVAATHAGVLAAPRRTGLGVDVPGVPVSAPDGGTVAAAQVVQGEGLAQAEADAPGGASPGGLGSAEGAAASGAVAASPSSPASLTPSSTASSIASWRVLVVGEALARRLGQRPLQARLGRVPVAVQVWPKLEQAMQALEQASVAPAEAVLMQCASLRAQDLPRLQALARAAGAQRVHVLYGFATTALCAAFEAASMALLRMPQDDQALATWLQPSCSPLALPTAVGPRRWDDAALADFAGLSTTIRCECPRHVADLLMQLSSFEAYSAECAHRDPADAALHAYLGQVAGTARTLFEQALERLAEQEGLTLPGARD